MRILVDVNKTNLSDDEVQRLLEQIHNTVSRGGEEVAIVSVIDKTNDGQFYEEHGDTTTVDMFTALHKEIADYTNEDSDCQVYSLREIAKGLLLNQITTSPYTVGKVIRDMLGYDDMDIPILASLWGVGDVEGIVTEDDEDAQKFTREEIINVFSMIDSGHDADSGINWESIRYAVEQVVEDRTK